MATGVLNASSSSAAVLAWAHCALPPPHRPTAQGSGATVALLNLDAAQPATVTFGGAVQSPVPRLEYVLSPAGGAPDARAVLLNGAPLSFAGGVLSPTPPRLVTDAAEPFVLAPRTYAFVTFPDASVAC